jgi:hypothetical protein
VSDEYFLPLDDYSEFILALTPFLKTLMERVKTGGCAFPLEVLVVDAENTMLAHDELRMDLDEPYRDLSGRGPEEKLPPVHWPVTATVTDNEGRTWNVLIRNPNGEKLQ